MPLPGKRAHLTWPEIEHQENIMQNPSLQQRLRTTGQSLWQQVSGDGTWLGVRRRVTSPAGVIGIVLLVLVIVGSYSLGAALTSNASTSPGSASTMSMSSDANSNPGNVPLATQTHGNQPAKFVVDSDGAKHFTLTTQQVMWEAVKGLPRVLAWTFDGTVPGPLIRVVAGDHVRITIVNKLTEPTTVHWHGLIVPSDQDGVPGVGQKPIAAGATFTYDFTIHEDNVGTFAYHSHYDDQRQVPGGMYGAFIVDPKPGTTEAQREPQVQEDYLQIISELGPYFVINGHSFPDTDVLHVKHGDQVRLRFINMGEMIHPMHLHGHNMSMIFKDGNYEQSPELVNTIAIAPGQTADGVFTAWAAPGSVYPLHCHILAHVMNPGQTGGDEMGGLISLIEYDK
jgi:manganese oxidase